MTVTARLELNIVSSYPGYVGHWSLRKDAELAGVPAKGDDVEVSEDSWMEVKYVVFKLDGTLLVRLLSKELSVLQTKETLMYVLSLATEHGWTQIGGPWKDQGR